MHHGSFSLDMSYACAYAYAWVCGCVASEIQEFLVLYSRNESICALLRKSQNLRVSKPSFFENPRGRPTDFGAAERQLAVYQC